MSAKGAAECRKFTVQQTIAGACSDPILAYVTCAKTRASEQFWSGERVLDNKECLKAYYNALLCTVNHFQQEYTEQCEVQHRIIKKELLTATEPDQAKIA